MASKIESTSISSSVNENSRNEPNLFVLKRDIKNINVLINRSDISSKHLDHSKELEPLINQRNKNESKYRLVVNLQNCLKQAHHDAHLYGSIIHIIVFSLVFFLLIYSHKSIGSIVYPSCFSNKFGSTRDKWFSLKSFSIGNCTKEFDIVLLFIIAFFNILTFLLILFDKHQAVCNGYRVKNWLIIFCFHAGGFPIGWILLLQLNHKILSSRFVIFALLATITSFLWQYLYFLFK